MHCKFKTQKRVKKSDNVYTTLFDLNSSFAIYHVCVTNECGMQPSLSPCLCQCVCSNSYTVAQYSKYDGRVARIYTFSRNACTR